MLTLLIWSTYIHFDKIKGDLQLHLHNLMTESKIRCNWRIFTSVLHYFIEFALKLIFIDLYYLYCRVGSPHFDT